MSWKEFVSHMLATTHKIEKVVVLNSDGQPLAVTDGLSVSDLEGRGLIKSMSDPARTITKLHIDNNYYTLFQGNDNTVIGTCPGRDRVFVAHISQDHVVVAFGKTTGHHGSFLFELKKNLILKEKQMLHGAERQTQQKIHRLSQQEILRMSQQEIPGNREPDIQGMSGQDMQGMGEQDIQGMSEQEMFSSLDNKPTDLLDSIMLSVDHLNSNEPEQQHVTDGPIHLSDSQVLLEVN